MEQIKLLLGIDYEMKPLTLGMSIIVIACFCLLALSMVFLVADNRGAAVLCAVAPLLVGVGMLWYASKELRNK